MTARVQQHREPAVTALIALLFLLLLVFVLFPPARVLGASVMRDGAPTLDVYREMLTARGAGVPLWNSLRLAATVALILAISVEGPRCDDLLLAAGYVRARNPFAPSRITQ